MAGDKTYITDNQGKQHRATRVHAVTPTDIVWSSNPNDYSVQVKIGGKWHRAILTMDAGASTFFENVNIDKALVVGSDGKNHTALIVKPESTVTLSDIKTDEHALVSGTTTGETAVVTYEENWSNVKYQDNVNVYKVLVTGSDGKVHTALLTTSSGGGGGVEAIVLGTSPLSLPDAIANSLQYVKAFGDAKQGLPNGYTQMNGITNGASTYVDTGIRPAVDDVEIELRVKPTAGSWYILQSRGSAIWGISGSSTGQTILLGWGGNGSLCQSAISRDTTHIYYIKATIKNSVATLYVKDETAGTEDTQIARYTSSLPPLPFWLYGNQNNDRVSAGNTVYMACIKVGGETVMDYVPALNASNVVGFYDKATGNFVVSNAGTLSTDQPAVPTPDAPMDIVSNNGVLKARHQSGLPWGYTLLDYIESTGTQYINTGVLENTVDYMEMEFTNVSESGFMFTNGTSQIGMQDRRYGTETNGTKYNIKQETINGVWLFTNLTNGTTRTNGVARNVNLLLFVLSDVSGNPMAAYYCNTRVHRFSVSNNGTLVRNMVPVRRNSDNVIGMYDLVSGQFFTNAGTGDFVAGATVNDIEVYADGTVETIEDTIGNTATTEMLLKIGDYQDEQEILSGVVTRNVGVKVLDGTENWTYYSVPQGVLFRVLIQDSVSSEKVLLGVLCNAYQVIASGNRTSGTLSGSALNYDFINNNYTTIGAWKAYLADQYAAGTPVIVIYPLATPTTESVTGQALQVTGGNNTLEITQASLDGLELEAKYTKVA